MSSRRARRQRAAAKQAAAPEPQLLKAAAPYRRSAPLFYATALRLGLVPEPPAVFTQPTAALPVVRPGSLLGLNDEETEQTR